MDLPLIFGLLTGKALICYAVQYVVKALFGCGPLLCNLQRLGLPFALCFKCLLTCCLFALLFGLHDTSTAGGYPFRKRYAFRLCVGQRDIDVCNLLL